jgi:hypothetical protein
MPQIPDRFLTTPPVAVDTDGNVKNQSRIDDLEKVLGLLLIELDNMGIKVKNADLLILLSKYASIYL